MSDAASGLDGVLHAAGAQYTLKLLWAHAAGDALIAAACIALAALLLGSIRRRPDLPRPGIAALVVCLLLLAVIHAPFLWAAAPVAQGLLAGAKIAAAAAGILAAVRLLRQLPALHSLPSRTQLERAQAALEQSHAEMETFMSSVSHDLRSPLTTIAGQAGLLELSLGATASDDLKRRVNRIHHSVRHMSELIEALLALSRISRRELRSETLDISALAQSTVETLRRKDPQRDVTITIQPQLQACGDRSMISDLLGHLLGNAWKFTAHTSGASIEVGTSQQAGATALYVRDNGAGFDMAYEPKLFKPFQRLHTPSEFEGAGIGLASAARIVARHGGKIWTQAAPGAGAAFYFTLPAHSDC